MIGENVRLLQMTSVGAPKVMHERWSNDSVGVSLWC